MFTLETPEEDYTPLVRKAKKQLKMLNQNENMTQLDLHSQVFNIELY